MIRRGTINLVLIVAVLWHSGCSHRQKPHDLRLRVVVKGQVVDTSGRPIPGAKVQARLGLELDGPAVEAGANGGFVAEASSAFWFKGCPSVDVSAPGHEEQYTYFDCWDQGERRFERTIVLKPSSGGAEGKTP